MFSVLNSSGTLINPQVNAAFQQVLSDMLLLIATLISAGIGMLVKLVYSHYSTNVVTKFVADRAVKYVEQALTSDSNEAKYQAAATIISDKFPRLSQVDVKHAIESSVLDLKSQLQCATNPPPPPTK